MRSSAFITPLNFQFPFMGMKKRELCIPLFMAFSDSYEKNDVCIGKRLA